MSFRLKTILGIALIEAVLLGVLLFSGLNFMSSTAEAEFMQRTQATARAFSVAAKNPLISSDLAELNALTREMLNYPGVAYARVRDAEGQVLVQAGDAAALARPPRPVQRLDALQDGLFDAVAEVSEAGTAFGRVELGVTAAPLQQRGADARRFGIGLAALEMIAVALFSWILGAYLTRQLADLSGAAKRLATGERHVQIPVRGRDELAQTAESFNQMSLRLGESYEALIARERDLRRVLENIQDGIVTLNRHGAVVATSPSAARIFGRDEAALQGEPFVMLFPAAARDAVEGFVREARGERTLRVEGPASAGAPQWLELQVNPIDGASGSEPVLLAVVRDVTLRVAAEQELRLRGQIIGAISVGASIADATRPDYPLVDVNAAFERITGYAADEVRGRNCNFLQGPDTDPQARQRIREALRAGREVVELLLNYRRDGTPFWNDLRIMPLRDDGGRLTHFVALQNDVSERIAAQAALQGREAFLRQVLDATHDGIVVLDEGGRVESFNAGAEQMFGLRADEVLGQPVSSMGLPGDRQLDELAAGGEEREYPIRRRDGRDLWIALRVAEVGDADRRRFLGVLRDITRRKLDEIELRHAKEVAEDAANAKSEFLANMSHEIRTPMHGMLGSIEMMRETPLNGQQRRLLDSASTSAGLLLGVIDEILDFSRLEAGKLRIESLEFDLRHTVEDVTAMLAQRAHAKRVELACFIAPEVPEMVFGDPIRLRQILVNLVGNAIKFTERGEVVVSVSLVTPPAEQSQPVLRFEVRDTGIGIAADKQARLFEPFVQADSSTSRRYGGSGLGLSIARRLVELMQGQIGLQSAEGAGSTFWFTLPVRAAREGRVTHRGQKLAGVRVLVVDDNSTNRVILHRYLTAWDAQSSSASSGDEALAKLQDAAAAGRPYDVALLDLNMPVMDGYALTAQIQADPALAATPLIILSSSMQDPARLAGLRVDVWLDKPVRQSDLYDAIMTVLRGRPEPAPVAPPPTTALPRFAGERVLLVEDNPISIDLGQQMLERRGLQVIVANDGAEAVARVQRGGVDVVLMDIQMPGMDGYEATRAIRAWEQAQGRGHLPIIALTAHAQRTDREKCLAAGMDDHVVKPYGSEALATVIARWLAPPPAVAAAHDDDLDAARLDEVRQTMREEYGDLLGRVREALDEQMQALSQAYERGDAMAARERMHAIKNTAGNVGALRVYELAAEMELELAADPPIMPPLARLRVYVERAQAALQRERGLA